MNGRSIVASQRVLATFNLTYFTLNASPSPSHARQGASVHKRPTRPCSLAPLNRRSPVHVHVPRYRSGRDSGAAGGPACRELEHTPVTGYSVPRATVHGFAA
eukprot:tig00000828_g4627.t1